MNNKIKIGFLTVIICGLIGFQSCKDMLDVDSNSYLNTGDNQLNSPNDSLYSVAGILKQLRTLGPRYLVLGELRGDMMAVTENADMDLQAIANFTATTDNPYVSTREYYSVINNCNYFLQHVDTNIISGGKKVMLGEYSAVKAIRAWTYLQLVMNYGKAVYLTEPILNIDDMNKDYPVMEPQQLIETLLSDFMNYLDETNYPDYGGNFNKFNLLSGKMVAGDLLLWLGAYTGNLQYYEMAASIYYRWIYDNGLAGAGYYRNMYSNSDFIYFSQTDWEGVVAMGGTGGYNEIISTISYPANSAETLTYPEIIRLIFQKSNNYPAFEYKVKPSQAGIDLWKNETYIHYNATTKELFYTQGDLRGYCDVYSMHYGSYYYAGEGDSLPTIYKYGIIPGTYYPTTNLYRTGKMYLRYAEALNALGKPSVAFAVLKYGLKRSILNDPKKINPEEITPMPAYCNFTADRFADTGTAPQSGIHSRGSGYPEQDTIYYAFTKETLLANRDYYGFPAHLATKQDSINFVDAMICKELGLETAFEGNRFHDLMRFSIRRGEEEFLAKWVGRRNPALTGTLMNRDKWYLPTPY